MLSNHYSMTYSNKYNWLVLIMMMLAGVLIRRFFILRHKGVSNFAYPAIAVAVLAGVIAWIAPKPSADPVFDKAVDIGQVQQVLQTRCIQCHAAKPSLMPSAAKGISLESLTDIQTHAQLIYQQAAVQKTMPLGNTTGMTEQERAMIAQWFEARTGMKSQ